MAILHRLTPDEIRQFTHYAWFVGLVPVYIRAEANEGAALEVRNWVPEFTLSIAMCLFGTFVFLWSQVNEDFEPEFPVTITGEIPGRVS